MRKQIYIQIEGRDHCCEEVELLSSIGEYKFLQTCSFNNRNNQDRVKSQGRKLRGHLAIKKQ